MTYRPLQTALLAVIIASSFHLPVHAASRAAEHKLVLASALSVNAADRTVTLRLHRGTHAGTPVWYIITDASDVQEAQRLHVVYAPNIAGVDGAAQHASKDADGYTFDGAPDFSPTRTFVAGATGFPPASATPGGVGDAQYSPFVHFDGIGGVLNAPIVATGAGPFDVTTHSNTEDRVVAIDTNAMTVTLLLARGFVEGRPVDYISTEASDPVAAAVERATYAPRLKRAPEQVTIPIGVVASGPRGAGGQGLAYLTFDTPLSQDATAANVATLGSPFNVLSFAPDTSRPNARTGYSPLWTALVAPTGATDRITDFATFGRHTPQAAGFVINCPVIAFE